MKSVIVGTAGHIDHGKSALVRALTGKDPDRLPEEKRRGITIDLGFADLELDGVSIGFVDVPGHERFIKNMLAGAHGIDMVALVVAADEGVMPQTREHFDICRLLAVRAGLVVITKIDLVDPGLLPLVVAEIEELVAGSFLEGAPVLTVSSKTGAGLEELKSTLQGLAIQVPARISDFITMLPVDRSFTMKGFGPVVTGTLISGELAEGADLELFPAGSRVRARGIQVHGKAVPKAFAGQRTAVNLGGVEASAIERGMVLAPAHHLEPVQIVDVHLQVLSDAPRPLRSRARVRFHAHTTEVLGRLQILSDVGELAPGSEGFAQVRLESPIATHLDERFILRSYSPATTIAGGTILNPFASKHRGKRLASVRQALDTLASGDRATQFSTFVALAKERGITGPMIAAGTGWNDGVLKEAAELAVQSGNVVDCDGVFISREIFDQLSQRALDHVRSHHKREPLARGLARETLRERVFTSVPPDVFRVTLSSLERDGLLVTDREVVHAKEHTVELSDEDTQLRNRLSEIFERAGLEPPALDTALSTAGQRLPQINRAKKIVQMLLEQGVLVRVQANLMFHRKALDELIGKLRAYGEKHEPDRTVSVTTFKDLAGVSRKYAIPLLEFLDRERITRRNGEHRIILKSG